MVRLFLLYAILIFAKRAPKMIMDLLKIKGEGIGLKGLNIKNKLGEAALVGDKVKKGMLYTEGKAKGVIGGASSGFKNTKGGLKEKLAGGVKGAITGSKNSGKEAVAKGDTKGLGRKAYKEVTPIARGGVPTMWDKAKAGLGQVTGKIGSKGFSNVERNNANDFANHKKRLIDMYGSKRANEILAKIGSINFGNQAEYDKKVKELKSYTSGFNGLSKQGMPTDASAVLEELAKDPSGQLFIRQNILSERKDVFAKLTSYDNQIATAMQTISPMAQQISAQKSIAEADKMAVEQKLNVARAAGDMNEINRLNAEIGTIDAKIGSYTDALNKDLSYKSAKETVDSLYKAKQEVYDEAVAKKVFEENGGIKVTDSFGTPVDFGIKEIPHGKESDLYAAMGGDAISKNNKALEKIAESIKELGKDPTPPKKEN